jgi:CBS domain-containing protein
VWWGTGNRVRASAVSGFAGQIVGAAVVVWAVWLAVFDFSPIAAVVTAIVGWPLWRGAAATRRSAKQRQHLGGLRVADVLHDEVFTAPDTASAATVAASLADDASGHVAVVDDTGQPRGVLSVERIRRAARDHPDRPVGRLMRRTPVIATLDEPLADVLERTYAKPRPVVVVEGDTAAALIEPTDIRAALARPSAVATDIEPADVWPGATSAA